MDKGVIFSAPMVRALLDGRKTQTRRLISGRNEVARCLLNAGFDDSYILDPGNAEWLQTAHHYAPGDRLYVREAYSVRGIYSDVVEVGYQAHQNASHTEFVEQWPVASAIDAKGKRPVVTWPSYKPSIHMPRWASRLWLAVTDVRVQRVQEISEEDARAEGIETTEFWRDKHPASICFSVLWDSLHTKHGERWNDNPWIVAITFDVNHGNIDASGKGQP